MESRGNRTGVPSGAAASQPLRHSLRPRGPIRFGITEAEHGDAVTLQIAGELDVLTAPKFAARLNTIVRRSDHDIVVDLRQADFLDSAGLQILLGVQRRLSHDARKLSVVCDEGPVRRVIELARLGDILGLVALS